jgi:hypothetical protein
MIEHEVGAENDDEDLEDSIRQVESWDALSTFLGELESRGVKIHGTQQDYSISELRAIIEKVRAGDSKPEKITRSVGLRDKVLKLLRKDK